MPEAPRVIFASAAPVPTPQPFPLHPPGQKTVAPVQLPSCRAGTGQSSEAELKADDLRQSLGWVPYHPGGHLINDLEGRLGVGPGSWDQRDWREGHFLSGTTLALCNLSSSTHVPHPRPSFYLPSSPGARYTQSNRSYF